MLINKKKHQSDVWQRFCPTFQHTQKSKQQAQIYTYTESTPTVEQVQVNTFFECFVLQQHNF